MPGRPPRPDLRRHISSNAATEAGFVATRPACGQKTRNSRLQMAGLKKGLTFVTWSSEDTHASAQPARKQSAFPPLEKNQAQVPDISAMRGLPLWRSNGSS